MVGLPILLASCCGFLTSNICSSRKSCGQCVAAVREGTPCGWCADAVSGAEQLNASARVNARRGRCLAHASRNPAPFVCPLARWISAGDPWHACDDGSGVDSGSAGGGSGDDDVDPAQKLWDAIWSAGGGLRVGEAFDEGHGAPIVSALVRERSFNDSSRALVPGCGRGYEALQLARAFGAVEGWDVSASAIAAARAWQKAHRGSDSGESSGAGGETGPRSWPVQEQGRVVFKQRNFFSATDGGNTRASSGTKFDLILDYTFLCTLPPTLRARWAARVASLLREDGGGGELVTLIFPIFDPGLAHASALSLDGGASAGGHEHEHELLQRGGPPFAMSPRLVQRLLAVHGIVPVELRKLNSSEAHAGRAGAAGDAASTVLGRWRFASALHRESDEKRRHIGRNEL